jgi:Zn-dependent protease
LPQILTRLLLYLPLLLMAVSAHEAAHAWAARWRGDDTAARQGRLSLLPFVHVDPWGTLLLPALLVVMQSSFFIAYAKPTPVDPSRLRRPKADFSLVALAGPLANLALALALTLVGALVFVVLGVESAEARLIVAVGIFLNVMLACLNLLPLPGFDGMKALYVFLPDRWCWRLQQAEPYFLVILVLAAFTQVLDLALVPVHPITEALCTVAGTGWPNL